MCYKTAFYDENMFEKKKQLQKKTFQDRSSWRIYSTHFLQKVWPFRFVKQWSAVTSLEESLGTKLKLPIFTLYLSHNLQSRILVFQKFMY